MNFIARYQKILILGVIIIIAFLLRFKAATLQSVWHDEAYVIHNAKFTSEIFKDKYDAPLYFLIISAISKLTDSYIIFRLVSILFSLASLLLIFIITKKVGGNKFGYLSSFYYAISAFSIHYAWQIRMYSLYSLLGLASIYYVTIL